MTRVFYFSFLVFCIANSAASHEHNAKLDNEFTRIVERHKLNTVGAALIKSGKVTWVGYYGEQSRGKPASEDTMFNVGSITKLVVTQTVLQLVENELISLDEPMSEYWVDPDLTNDPRHNLLTPRMVLSHSTGLPNWRYFSDDRKLKFINSPGTVYGYSGEGFEYLANFIEKKLDTPFEQLAKQYVFEPAGLKDISLSVDERFYPHITHALDANGKFYGHYCSPYGFCSKPGDVSVAGNMMVTINDFSQFLIWSMKKNYLKNNLEQQVTNVAVGQPIIKGFDCNKDPKAHCPTSQGYGLGWNVTTFDGGLVVGHGGSDWSLITLTYYNPNSLDGVIIFINAPNSQALPAMYDAIKILDPESPKIAEYRFRRDRQK